jgi:hypothetical protein
LIDRGAALEGVIATQGERTGADFHHIHDVGEVGMRIDHILD